MNLYANSMDPDQTAPYGAVWSGSTLFAINDFQSTTTDNEADKFSHEVKQYGSFSCAANSFDKKLISLHDLK